MRLRADFEQAKKQAEAVVATMEKKVEQVAPQAKPALENARPALVEETAVAFERAAVEAALRSSGATIIMPGSKDMGADILLDSGILLDLLTRPAGTAARKEAIRRRLKGLEGSSTDPSSTDAPKLGD